MSKDENGETSEERWARADKKVHPVETQWHYPIMTKHGFVAETKEGIGFVRSYAYVHPRSGRKIRVSTGVNTDYWDDETHGFGLWAELEPHLVKIASELDG